MPSSSSPPDRHESVKAVHLNRDRIKERIQEKHRQQSRLVRQERLSSLRESDQGGLSPSGSLRQQHPPPWPSSAPVNCSPTGAGSMLAPSSSPQGLCFGARGTLVMPVVQDWSDIGNEFGVNIHDSDVMECLLALEDEIRQEQLFLFYDQTNGNEWEDYYNSLTS
ncbi:phosphatidylcholine:ceramide cholinephosphotransferase 2 [Lotmaria passim]